MSIGCSIYFTPADSSWVGTPEFVHGIASFLGVDTFDSLRVYREAPSTSESRPHPEQEAEKLLERQAVPVEAAIELQYTDRHYTNVLSFSTTPVMEAMARDVTTTLPPTLSEGFAPTQGNLYNGPWKHYDYNSGAKVSDSGCCLILSNNLGYPVELDAYLAAFVEVPSVVRLRQRLEELSGQQWRALIDLT